MNDARTEELRGILEKVQEAHNKFYASAPPDYELMPMYFLYRGEHSEIIALANLPTGAKDQIVAMVGRRAKEEGVTAYAFTNEGWTIPPETLHLRVAGERFADRPDKIEILSIEAGLITGEAAHLMAYIHRSEDKPPQLAWKDPVFSTESGVVMKSRFNIFKPDPPRSPDEFISRAKH